MAVPRMPRLPAVLLALLMACAIPAPARAASTQWSCWYDGDVAALCVPITQALPAKVAFATPGHSWKLVRIPLLTIVTDIEGVRRLVRAVMCGRQPTCSATFDLTPDVAAIEALDDDE